MHKKTALTTEQRTEIALDEGETRRVALRRQVALMAMSVAALSIVSLSPTPVAATHPCDQTTRGELTDLCLARELSFEHLRDHPGCDAEFELLDITEAKIAALSV